MVPSKMLLSISSAATFDRDLAVDEVTFRWIVTQLHDKMKSIILSFYKCLGSGVVLNKIYD